jgi:hypothetical protein
MQKPRGRFSPGFQTLEGHWKWQENRFLFSATSRRSFRYPFFLFFFHFFPFLFLSFLFLSLSLFLPFSFFFPHTVQFIIRIAAFIAPASRYAIRRVTCSIGQKCTHAHYAALTQRLRLRWSLRELEQRAIDSISSSRVARVIDNQAVIDTCSSIISYIRVRMYLVRVLVKSSIIIDIIVSTRGQFRNLSAQASRRNADTRLVWHSLTQRYRQSDIARLHWHLTGACIRTGEERAK